MTIREVVATKQNTDTNITQPWIRGMGTREEAIRIHTRPPKTCREETESIGAGTLGLQIPRKGTKKVAKNISFIFQGCRPGLQSHHYHCLLAYFVSFLKYKFHFLLNKHCNTPGHHLKHLDK